MKKKIVAYLFISCLLFGENLLDEFNEIKDYLNTKQNSNDLGNEYRKKFEIKKEAIKTNSFEVKKSQITDYYSGVKKKYFNNDFEENLKKIEAANKNSISTTYLNNAIKEVPQYLKNDETEKRKEVIIGIENIKLESSNNLIEKVKNNAAKSKNDVFSYENPFSMKEYYFSDTAEKYNSKKSELMENSNTISNSGVKEIKDIYFKDLADYSSQSDKDNFDPSDNIGHHQNLSAAIIDSYHTGQLSQEDYIESENQLKDNFEEKYNNGFRTRENLEKYSGGSFTDKTRYVIDKLTNMLENDSKKAAGKIMDLVDGKGKNEDSDKKWFEFWR